MKILVVEDQPDNLELFAYLLRGFGHDVVTAMTGEEGLDLATKQDLDLILMDLQLPGIDGFETLSALRDSGCATGVPVVALTSFAMVGDRDKALSAGFNGFISKPITPETFVREIESFHANGTAR